MPSRVAEPWRGRRIVSLLPRDDDEQPTARGCCALKSGTHAPLRIGHVHRLGVSGHRISCGAKADKDIACGALPAGTLPFFVGLAEEIERDGGTATAVPVDVTNRADVVDIVAGAGRLQRCHACRPVVAGR